MRTADSLANIALAIVSLATVTVLVTSPQTAGIIRESGRAFSSSVRTAMGR